MSESKHFEPPTNDDGDQTPTGQDSADVGFAEPDESQLGDAEFQASTEMLSGVPDEITSAHEQLTQALRSQDRSHKLMTVDDVGEGQTQAQVSPETLVQAVAIGYSEPGHGEPGKVALHVYTSEETTPDEARAAFSAMGVQDLNGSGSSAVPIITHKATFDAQDHRFRIRRAAGGVSVGHVRVTAGTLGGLCLGRRTPRDRRLMVLSNNHVVANSNNANAGDCVVQPGTYDGGRCPGDQIAILESYVPIRFGGPVNYVDAATAWCWPDRVRGEHIYRSGNSLHLFNVGNSPIYPQLGMIVGKTGRTTQLTQGRIVQLNWSGWVNYGVGYAWFQGQFVVASTSSLPFSAPGDSGSWVWEWRAGLPPVGLLFAGGGGYTICSPMPWATLLLDVNLVTSTYW